MRRPALPLAVLLAALALAAGPAFAQTPPAAPAAPPPVTNPVSTAVPADVASVDAIIEVLYAVISGEPDQPRDWARFHSLFLPGAMMGSVSRGPDGAVRTRSFTPEGYVALASPQFARNAFYEHEIGRRTTRFGPVIQLMSVYETRNVRDSADPVVRGVNSITLFDDGQRLWITSITWSAETPDTPIPADWITPR